MLLSWLDLVLVGDDVSVCLMFVWGVLGFGVEWVIVGIVVVSLVLCGDWFGLILFDDVF